MEKYLEPSVTYSLRDELTLNRTIVDEVFENKLAELVKNVPLQFEVACLLMSGNSNEIFEYISNDEYLSQWAYGVITVCIGFVSFRRSSFFLIFLSAVLITAVLRRLVVWAVSASSTSCCHSRRAIASSTKTTRSSATRCAKNSLGMRTALRAN